MTAPTVDRERETGKGLWDANAWATEATRSPSPLSAIVYVVLLLMAAVSLVGIVASTDTYLRAAIGLTTLRLEVTGLEFVDDDDPRIHMRFRLHNDAQIELLVERFFFTLNLNGEWVSTNLSTYTGKNPAADPLLYRRATELNRTVGPGETLDLAYTVFVYPAQMDVIRRAQAAGTMQWSVRADIPVWLPNAERIRVVRLTAPYLEEGT